FLVGATLYHALTRRPLHPGSTFIEVLRHVVEPAPLIFPPGAPALLVQICRKALRFAPEERFDSIEAMRRALQDALQHQASLSLLDTATVRVLRIEDHRLSESHRRRAFDEARFAVEEAGRLWPDNPRLYDVERDARISMVRLEMAAGHVDAAERMMAELCEVPPDLATQLDVLREHKRKQAKRAASLEKLAGALDLRVGARGRLMGFVFMAASTTAVTVATFAARINIQHPEMLWMQVGLLAAGGFIAVPILVRYRHSRVGLQLIGLVATISVFMPIFTAVGWRLQMPIVELLVLESLAMAPGYVFAGIALDRRVAVGAVAVAGGVVFSLMVPAHAPLGVMMAQVGGMLMTLFALMVLPVAALTDD
ncbi:MAG: hypothetical protein AAF449_08995, partial [Myxococcota bacterium]